MARRARLALASLRVIAEPLRADRELAEIEDDALLAGDEPRLLFARAWRGSARWALVDLDEAIRLLRGAVSLAEQLGYGVPQIEIGATLAGALAAAGRVDAARERIAPLVERSTGRLRGTAALWWCVIEAVAGDPEAAARAAAEVRGGADGLDAAAEATVQLTDALVPFARDRDDPVVRERLAALRAPGTDGRGSAWSELLVVALVGSTVLSLVERG
jgi:hypothetical protein